jgi:predicted MFS family arabinose efflux permease
MTSTNQHKPINETMLLALLAAINFTHIMDFVIIAPLNPFLKASLGMSTKQFGILMAAYTMSAGISGFLGFFTIDKYDRRKAILFSYAGFLLGNLFCALASSYV